MPFESTTSRPLLQVFDLVKSFGTGRTAHTVVDHVSFELAEGEVLGLVGESGSGKSTTVRCVMGLEKPDGGDLDFDRIDLVSPSRSGRRRFLREVQMVFQDPYSSLDPRMTVRSLVAEPLVVAGECRRPSGSTGWSTSSSASDWTRRHSIDTRAPSRVVSGSGSPSRARSS
ncbi:hypothetical protein GCM10025864_18740 [Luteimicrobium album]|uniref:ABC transporter domain-containing protein n=1 Tax=Luteimicrobium album TaxID=1054550 RepID=A0ABQ6I049_9MICO|nr:ATP-binding cassette domain-containing protein [Luteimicrobium album]GMA24115.1 hypothetical protein GCM10025864_18740 [Luteimicrobium album]